MGFEKNQIDPCMFLKEKENGRVYICLYVDDGIITGDDFLMSQTIAELKSWIGQVWIIERLE
jgi:hypothetical protein